MFTNTSNLLRNDICEDHPLIFAKILSLKDLASIQIVIEPCYEILQSRKFFLLHERSHSSSESDSSDDENELVFDIPDRFEFLYNLPLPTAIRAKVEQHVFLVLNEMKKWLLYQNHRFYGNYTLEEFFQYLRYIVWKPDGQISYKKTALKMLCDPTLNETKRFKIISVYCLEEEIKKISRFQLEDHYTRSFCGNDDMMLYWYHFIIGDLHCHDEFSDLRMIENYLYVNNIHAILYFWNRLDSEVQLRTAVYLIRRHGLRYQSDILSQMSAVQQKHMFMQVGSEIILNFASKESYFEFAVLTWSRVKDTITKEELVTFITKMITHIHGWRFCDLFIVMLETIPNHMKRVCFDIKNGEIINQLTNFQNTIRGKNRFLFLSKILSNFNNNDRRYVFDRIIARANLSGRNLFNSIIYYEEPWILDKFTTLCLPDERERVEFWEKNITHDTLVKGCLALLKQSKRDYFEEFVTLHLPFVTNVAEYKMQLLHSEKGIEFCLKFLIDSQYDKLNEIIDYVFSQKTHAENFRMYLFSSYHTLDLFHQWLCDGIYTDVDECLAKCLSCEAEEIFKKNMIRFYRCDNFCEFFDSERKLQALMSWFLRDDKSRLSGIKNSLHLHHIFSAMLARCVGRFVENRRDYFSTLDFFLHWYFASPEEVNKFKIEEIFEFNEIPCIMGMFTSEGNCSEYDTDRLTGVLHWIFNDNLDEIQRFKSVFAHHAIVNFL